MLADPSFWQKFCSKGVDIAASVAASTISAIIIAGIATLTWKLKRRRDLRLEEDKQRQHNRIALELEREKRVADRRALVKRLARERDDWVAVIAGATGSNRLQDGWERYGRG